MRATLKSLSIAVAARWPTRRFICWRVSSREPQVALTFDDGPHPTFTPQVLDILAAHGAQATFFVLGREVERNPGLLRRAVADGHEIGIHGYDHTHCNLPGQMERTIGIVRGLGALPRAIRPPGGRLSAELLRWSVLRGMSVCLWSFDVQDSRRHEGKASRRRPSEELSPGDIVLLHDDNPVAVDELPELITIGRQKNLGLVCVSELVRA